MDEIRILLESEGWQHVQRFIDGKIEFHKTQILTCPLDCVDGHRKAIRAFESIYTHIDKLLEE